MAESLKTGRGFRTGLYALAASTALTACSPTPEVPQEDLRPVELTAGERARLAARIPELIFTDSVPVEDRQQLLLPPILGAAAFRTFSASGHATEYEAIASTPDGVPELLLRACAPDYEVMGRPGCGTEYIAIYDTNVDGEPDAAVISRSENAEIVAGVSNYDSRDADWDGPAWRRVYDRMLLDVTAYMDEKRTPRT